MKLTLTKPIVVLDTETTGVDVTKDKVVSIACVKINVDGTRERKYSLVNPQIPIPKGASDVHGILDEHVQSAPTFKQISKALSEWIGDSDLLGFNSDSFDLPLLQEEFDRCDIEFPAQGSKTIDAFSIFRTFEKRDLSAAVRFYCNRVLEGAHNAEADTDATLDVFVAQLEKYPELTDKSIDEIVSVYKSANSVDLQGNIIKNDAGEFLWNFGKNKGKLVTSDDSYIKWVLGPSSNFSGAFKKLVTRIKEGKQ